MERQYNTFTRLDVCQDLHIIRHRPAKKQPAVADI